MLSGGKSVLASTVDSNRRNGLHFSAAIGSVEACRLLIQAGTEVNAPDVEGYTPLHMASGYLAVPTVQVLLEAGADPEQKDKKGLSPLELVEDIREKIKAAGGNSNPMMMSRRVALEEVARILTENLFEDVAPGQVLASREAADGTREFLVQWPDGRDHSWVPQKYMADDVIVDFDSGLEYAEAESILEEKEEDGGKVYLVRWRDGAEDSWEPRKNLSEDIVGRSLGSICWCRGASALRRIKEWEGNESLSPPGSGPSQACGRPSSAGTPTSPRRSRSSS